MNRKYIMLILLFLVICYSALSQTMKSATAIVGYSDNGFATLVNFQIYPEQSFKEYYEIGVYAGFLNETKTEYKVPLNVYTLNAGYHFRANSISAKTNSIVTTLGLGGVIGKEDLNNGNENLPDGALIITDTGLIYGGYGAIETDICLTDNFSIIGRYTHFYHSNSKVSKSKFMVGIGLKYVFI